MFPFKDVQNHNISIGLDAFEMYCREKIISNANLHVREEAGIQISLRDLQRKYFIGFAMDRMRRTFILKSPEKDLRMTQTKMFRPGIRRHQKERQEYGNIKELQMFCPLPYVKPKLW